MAPILNVVLPVFAIIAAGYACGRWKLLGDDSSQALNGFVYWVALPVLLFHAMARVEVSEIFNWAFLGAYVGAQALVWGGAMVLHRGLFRGSLAEGTMFGMNTVYGNTGYMGIPLALTAFGESSSLPTIISAVVNTALIVGVGVCIIEISMKKGGGGKVARDVFTALIKNPLIMAPVAGILWSALGLGLPQPVDTFCRILGAAAGPCALFAIGLFLVGKPISEGIGEVALMTILKLIALPVITWVLIQTVFPMDPLWSTVCILMSALPMGAGTFVLASRYNLYVSRTSTATLASTVLSVISLSIFFSLFPPLN